MIQKLADFVIQRYNEFEPERYNVPEGRQTHGVNIPLGYRDLSPREKEVLDKRDRLVFTVLFVVVKIMSFVPFVIALPFGMSMLLFPEDKADFSVFIAPAVFFVLLTVLASFLKTLKSRVDNSDCVAIDVLIEDKQKKTFSRRVGKERRTITVTTLRCLDHNKNELYLDTSDFVREVIGDYTVFFVKRQTAENGDLYDIENEAFYIDFDAK